MRCLRWLLVFSLYAAAELMGPVGAAPMEGHDGGAEESVHLAGQRRVARHIVERGRPLVAATPAAAAMRWAAERRGPRPALARGTPVRKVPPPARESASAPDDH